MSDDEKLKILVYGVAEKHLSETWRKLEVNGLKPMLIKGWAAAQYYPKPYLRHLGDFDIAVCPKYFQKACEIIDRENLKRIDLHAGLRHLDTVLWDDLFENSLIQFCEGVEIRVLRPEDHLRVLCVHWLMDGGEHFGKLWDIFYLVENRSPMFDWERCFGQVSEKRRRWIVITIGLVHKYLGLSLNGLPFEKEAKNLPLWMTEFLEKEWKDGYRLLPLHFALKDLKEFRRQILKRFPPNPIQATVDVEGDLDSRFQIFYQFKSIFKRIFPSLKRIWNSLRKKGNGW